jgi:hypothetical protein
MANSKAATFDTALFNDLPSANKYTFIIKAVIMEGDSIINSSLGGKLSVKLSDMPK